MEKQYFSNSFLVPVNKKVYPDYYTVIKKPMDLHTMKRKLQDLVYDRVTDFTADLEKVVHNCIEYSGKRSAVAKDADQMLEFFKVCLMVFLWFVTTMKSMVKELRLAGRNRE